MFWKHDAPPNLGPAALPKLRYLAAMLAVLAVPAHAQFTVTLRPLADEKAVFATVESQNVVPARARIGGTIVELEVKDGDRVVRGQTIALVGDDKLQLQLRSLDAQIRFTRRILQTREEALTFVRNRARGGQAGRASHRYLFRRGVVGGSRGREAPGQQG